MEYPIGAAEEGVETPTLNQEGLLGSNFITDQISLLSPRQRTVVCNPGLNRAEDGKVAMSTISSSSGENAPAVTYSAPATSPANSPTAPTTVPESPQERSLMSSPEPPPSSGVADLSAGLQNNFAAGPAQSLELNLPGHTQARLAHTRARLNDPSTTPEQRRELLREQAQLRSQQYETQHRPPEQTRHELPPGGEVLGRGLDGVRSITGDLGPIGSAQRVRQAYNNPDLTPSQRGSTIGGELAGAAGGKVASTVGMARGAAMGGRLGLQAGAVVGMSLAGPPGAFAGGILGIAGGTVLGGAAGWLLGGTAGDAAARPAGSSLGGVVGDRLAR